MAGDWIKLHRKLLEHPIMAHDGLCRLWIYCLMRANWKDSQWLVPGTLRMVDVPRGSFIAGRKALHTALYPKDDKREMQTPSESTVWRWLHALQGMGCLKLKNVDNRCSMVTICNYNTYQDDTSEIRTTDEQLADSRRTAGEQLVNTEEEGKKERRKEVNTGRFVPPTVDQVAEYCLERQNGIDPKAFVNHYETSGWMRGKAKVKDWKACVRTWESNNKAKPSADSKLFDDAEFSAWRP